jgi:tetratricopeptide (TPR) repeat protein
MTSGIIAKILDLLEYHYHSFEDEIGRAFGIFFNKEPPQNVVPSDENYAMRVFNEWFIYDYKSTNGKSILEIFCDDYLHLVSKKIQKESKELLHSWYSVFEVRKVEFDRGLHVEDLKTSKTYFVNEVSMTREVTIESVFAARVVRLGGRYEFVGYNPIALPRVDKNYKRKMKIILAKEQLTPKDIYDSLSSSESVPDKPILDIVPLEYARENFSKMLETFGLSNFVSVSTVENWIEDLEWKERPQVITGPLYMLFGLLPNASYDVLKQVAKAYYDLYPHIPQKGLAGKTPYEKVLEREEAGKSPDMSNTVLSTFDIDFFDEYANTAARSMVENDIAKALDNYDAYFRKLKHYRTTNSEIYRAYANKASAHTTLGEYKLARRLLKYAIKLNPNYQFADELLKQVDKASVQEESEELGGFRLYVNMKRAGKYSEMDVEKMSTEEIFVLLEELGITLDEVGFVEACGEYNSAMALSENVLVPDYDGNYHDIDYLYVIARVLWKRLVPNKLSIETFVDLTEELYSLTSPFKEKKLLKALESLSASLKQVDKSFVTELKNTDLWEVCLCDLFYVLLSRYPFTEKDGAAEDLLKLLTQKFDAKEFELINLLEDASAKDTLVNMLKRYKSPELSYYLGEYFYKNKGFETAERLYLLAKTQGSDSPSYILETVLPGLEGVYKKQKEKDKLGKVRDEMTLLEKKTAEDFDKFPLDLKMMKKLDKTIKQEEKKKFEEDYAVQYSEMLDEYNINFKTDTKVHVEVKTNIPRGTGRNDPCPCGAKDKNGRPIKYKKCHGKCV